MTESAFTARRVALVTAIGLAIIAAFQVALALGVPWGRAAYGGTSATLQPELRVASGVATVVWLLAAAVVLGRGGLLGIAALDCLLPPGDVAGSRSAGAGGRRQLRVVKPLGAVRLGPAGTAAVDPVRRPSSLASGHPEPLTDSAPAAVRSLSRSHTARPRSVSSPGEHLYELQRPHPGSPCWTPWRPTRS